jgi:hypothetical protein
MPFAQIIYLPTEINTTGIIFYWAAEPEFPFGVSIIM